MKSLYYVGMDVHKDSVKIAVLKGMEKETVYETTVKNDIPKIIKNSALRCFMWVTGLICLQPCILLA